jgi:hypothetical protein
MAISDGCSIVNNSCTGSVGGGMAVGMYAWDLDKLRFGSMGKLIAAMGWTGNDSTARITISSSSIANNTSNGAAGGGVAAISRSVVTLANGTAFVGNRAINGSGGGVFLTGSASFDADSTVLFDGNIVPRGFVGSTIVAFGSSRIALPSRGNLTKCSGGVYLGRTPCGVGETQQHDVCVCCPPHTFSFNNGSCQTCPANAACPGANIVEPLPGYWSSSPASIQMHRCPLFKTACDYVD